MKLFNRKSIVVGSLIAIIMFAAFQINAQACDNDKECVSNYRDCSEKHCDKKDSQSCDKSKKCVSKNRDCLKKHSCNKSKKCASKSNDCPKKACDKKDGMCPIKKKFFKKASFILCKHNELGLTDKQTEKIKELMLNLEKEFILKEAQIKVLALDIKSLMCSCTIDVAAVNTLIDKKYALMANKTKFLINSLASLKNVLNDDQKKKMKKLCSSKKKTSCPLTDGKKEEKAPSPN